MPKSLAPPSRLAASFYLRLSLGDREKIDAIASKQGKPRAAVVREAISLFLLKFA